MAVIRMELLPKETFRYSRQLPIIGLEGQKKIKNARILCVGAGGLGCPALQYLAASGIGTLGILDDDVVELSNLPRQILFNEHDIGQKKAVILAAHLNKMNPHVTINIHTIFFKQDHTELLSAYDIILDATDNYQTRYLLNAVCQTLKKPLVSASVSQFKAQLSVFNYQEGPCYQCLYQEQPLEDASTNCSMMGVLGVVPGVAGVLQASEAIKIVLGTEGVLSGKLLCIDLLTMNFSLYNIPKLDCSSHPRVHGANSLCSATPYSLTPFELKKVLQSNQPIQLIDVRESYEREIFHIGGEHIPLADIAQALTQFDKMKPVVIYCQAGVRSAHALQLFLAAGFNEAYHLEGGLYHWQAQVLD